MKYKMPIILLLVLSGKSFGLDVEKYCGSGWSKYVVPDKFLGCKFSIACKEHDECYGRCDKDGDLFGTDYCNLPESSPERTQSKRHCDAHIESKINEINNDNLKCQMFAALYRAMVSFAGQGPFNGNEASDLMVKLVDTSESEAEVVQKAFLIHNLSTLGKIDGNKFESSSNDSISFNVKQPTIKSELIRDGNLVLKKGANLEQLRSLNIEHQ